MEEPRIIPYFIYDGIRFNLQPIMDAWVLTCPACGNPALVDVYAMNSLGAVSGALTHDCGWRIWCHDGAAEDI